MKKLDMIDIDLKIQQAGYDTQVSNNSCEDFYCVEVWLNGCFIGEPMFFNDGTVQIEMELFSSVDAFIQRIFEWRNEQIQNCFD
jgi:hypothetical protein